MVKILNLFFSYKLIWHCGWSGNVNWMPIFLFCFVLFLLCLRRIMIHIIMEIKRTRITTMQFYASAIYSSSRLHSWENCHHFIILCYWTFLLNFVRINISIYLTLPVTTNSYQSVQVDFCLFVCLFVFVFFKWLTEIP